MKDSIILYGVQITGYILPFVTQPYLSRTLGPENIGLIGLGTALALYFASLVEYGFGITGPRQIAVAQDQPAEVASIYGRIFGAKLSLLALSALILLLVLSIVPQYRVHWILYCVSFLQVVGWCLSPNWLLQGLQRMRYVAFADYGAKIVSVALIFVLVRHKSDYLYAAALQSGGFLVAACIGLAAVFRTLKVRITWPDWGGILTEMKLGWPVFLSMACVTVMTSSNTLILGFLGGNAQVGYLSSAMRLIIALRALGNPINTAIYPHMSKLAARSPRAGIEFLQKRVFWVIVPFLAISLGLLVFAPWIVRIIFGKQFGESGILLRLMAFTPCLYITSMCFGNYMLAFGFQKEWARITIRVTVLNFLVLAGLLLVMTPARAVALTTSVIDLASLLWGVLLYRRTVGEVLARPVTT